jgi:hypothetical protein
MTTMARRETDLLDALRQHFSDQGYEFFVQPPSQMLPQFMGGFRPDAIAVTPQKKIAIEVKNSSQQSKEQFEQLARIFAPHADWEIRFYYAESPPDFDRVEAAPLERIKQAVDQARKLRRDGQLLPSLLVARAMLEALARNLLPDATERPQPARKLIEDLAAEGWITPTERSQLRGISQLGNAAAHGQLDAKIDERQIDVLLSILTTLLAAAEDKASSVAQ